MFGTKKRREIRERKIEQEAARQLSLRPSPDEAIKEVLQSQDHITLRSAGLVITGNKLGFTLADEDSYYDTQRYLLQMLTEVRSQVGRGYKCELIVYGDYTGDTISSILTPGWRDYARPQINVFEQFESEREFTRWESTPVGRRATIRRSFIAVSKK
jgi:hypothetical protein